MKLAITHRIELVVLNVSDPLSLPDHVFCLRCWMSSEGHRIVVQRKKDIEKHGNSYLSSFNHEHAPECPMYGQTLPEMKRKPPPEQAGIPCSRINNRNFYHLMTVIPLSDCRLALLTMMVSAPWFARNVRAFPFTPVSY